MQVWTTLKRLRNAGACKDRYRYLRRCLGKGYGDDTPIDIVTILDHNGLDDVLWIPHSELDGDHIDQRYRLFAVACCQPILRLMCDQRSRDAVKAAHLYAHGELAVEELSAAWSAVWSSARSDARSAALSAASNADLSAVWSSARDAARSAALSAARDASRDAAKSASRDAAKSASRDAAKSASRDAAKSAASGAAMSAAWSAAREEQSLFFKIIFSADLDEAEHDKQVAP